MGEQERNMDRIEAVFLLDTIWEYSCKKENLGE